MNEPQKVTLGSKPNCCYQSTSSKLAFRLVFRKKRLVVFVLVVSLLFALDFFSKAWINRYFGSALSSNTGYPYGGVGVFHQVFGIDFCINRVTNRGGAWGVFASYSYLLLTVRLIIIAALFVHTLFVNRVRARDFPFALLLTGAAGNLFDFFFYGHVIDFLHFILWGYSFPVFNFADVMIFCGVALLLLQSIRKKDGQLPIPDQSGS